MQKSLGRTQAHCSAWLGKLEEKGTEECPEGMESRGQILPISQFGLGWTLLAVPREEALALPRHRMCTLSGLWSESFSPGCFYC